MQLTDAEIREILRRRKIEKIRKQKRRRRFALISLIIVIVLIIILVKTRGNSGSSGAGSEEDSKAASEAAADRGIIFIDPGHGGMDSGSDDDHDRYEKDDTLKLSLALRDQLQKTGYTVEMSRTEDELVDRTQRGKMANKCGAQLFISVHRNKAAAGGKGIEGFIPKRDDAQSRLLGENLIHFLGRVGFAERTIRAGTLNSSAEDYEELAATNMPSVLIEVGFLSNAGDNARFDNNLDINARAMAAAIDFTYLTIFEPEKGAEYGARLKTIEKTADRVRKSTVKAARGISEHIEFDVEEDDSAGIDPES